ncbi:penicillin acylase family protein [Methylocapsa palsarum]|uniref:Penicillin amidase n=1 Tax=Methylocapsa palsarum TaxID=1612308 RepID=A0A1I4APZ2_9HYPH|nr:penicillin acylase family protein [Methylocapsa palsarum]SFK58290.1 penicillin amidase [Methylocapsa palsarum]
MKRSESAPDLAPRRRVRSIAIVWAARALGLGVALLAGVVSYALYAPLPLEGGAVSLDGLVAEVKVDFDPLGIPRIDAANRVDAFHALGFVTARDRLFQMDLLRRETAGRLAEIFGPATLEEDRWNRRMGFGELAGVIVERLPAPQRQLLDAYAAGVNQAMATATIFPVEFTLLGYKPAPWRPEDSILVILSMHSTLSWSGDQERTASVMRAAMPATVVNFLTPESDCYNELLTPRNPARCAPDAIPVDDLISVLHEAGRDSRKRVGEGGPRAVSGAGNPRGSNAFVVGKARTRDGRAILANDMHLQLMAPNVWYRAELNYQGAHLAGLTLPGVPMLIAGSNGKVAWGLTSVEGDFVDLVTIEEDPADKGRYKTPTGFLPFGTRSEIIHVRGGPDEAIEERTTIWGPLLPEPLLGQQVAAHWTALDPAATDLGLADMADVETVGAAITLLHRVGGPPLNVLLSDSAGDIGWTYMGRLPKRVGMDGLFAESWADGGRGWDGYVAPDQAPSIVNPPSGILVSANQRMLGAEYPGVIGHDFSGGYRAWRITQRLTGLEVIGESDMLAAQLDTQTDVYRYYQSAALRALEGAPVQTLASFAGLRRALEDWDGRAETNSLGLAVLVEFREALVEAVLTPLFHKCRELDPSFAYFWSGADVPVQRMIESGRTELLPGGGAFRDWPEFLRSTLLRSSETLAARHGRQNIAPLTWGDVNKADIRHPLSEAINLLGPLLDMPRAALPGCGRCVRLADGKYGASERMVVAPGREAEGFLHMPGGQSGQPASPNYSDQQAAWTLGLPTPFLSAKAQRTLYLRPRPAN